MLCPKDRAVVIDLQDKIMALLFERQEAAAQGDGTLVGRLQQKIDRLRAECEEVRRGEHAG